MNFIATTVTLAKASFSALCGVHLVHNKINFQRKKSLILCKTIVQTKCFFVFWLLRPSSFCVYHISIGSVVSGTLATGI